MNRPYDWRDEALCAQVDTDLFFPDDGGPIRAPKRICAACPVRRECLEYALANNITEGIWGGTTRDERRALKCGDVRNEAAA